MARSDKYVLRGRWPQGAQTEHKSNNLNDLKVLGRNWKDAGADAVVSMNNTITWRP